MGLGLPGLQQKVEACRARIQGFINDASRAAQSELRTVLTLTQESLHPVGFALVEGEKQFKTAMNKGSVQLAKA